MAVTIRKKDPEKTPHTTLELLVESKDQTELTTAETRAKVLAYARGCGFNAGGLNSLPSPYPIDEDGKCDDDLVLGKRSIKCWQAEYVVQMGIR